MAKDSCIRMAALMAQVSLRIFGTIHEGKHIQTIDVCITADMFGKGNNRAIWVGVGDRVLKNFSN